MKRIPLAELASKEGQATVAKLLGVSPAAICKALGATREIYVIDHGDGKFSAEELRPFPSQGSPDKRPAA